jgi:excisionase family DNA binding protein
MSGSSEPAEVLRDAHYASRRLGVPFRRIYELVAAGDLACYKLGRRTMRFSDRQIDEYLRTRESEVAS